MFSYVSSFHLQGGYFVPYIFKINWRGANLKYNLNIPRYVYIVLYVRQHRAAAFRKEENPKILLTYSTLMYNISYTTIVT